MEQIFVKLRFVVLFVATGGTVQAAELIVETSLGGIKGRNFSSFSGRQFSAFRGIPYAKAPIGALRFHVIGLINNPVPFSS
jgi:carboxylesterase type B